MRILMLILVLLPGTAIGALSKLEVNRNESVLAGKSFGLAGSYRKLSGKAHFELDPNAPSNQQIVDLKLAPKNSKGLVEFNADFYLITPSDPAKSNGKLL